MSEPYVLNLSEENLVLNGSFDQGLTAWAANPTGTHVGQDYGLGGPGIQVWPEFSNNVGYLYQEIYLPTHTTAVAGAFSYRFVPGPGASLGFFRVRLITANSSLATLLETASYPGDAWQAAEASLRSEDVATLNHARATGHHVHLVFELCAQFLYVNIDDVSLAFDGQTSHPALEGSIGYIGLDGDGHAQRVARIEPDGDGNQTLWTHPGPVAETNFIADVAWKPGSSELAFVSNHESVYSAFHSDVYACHPDGSSLRRITNPPSKARLDLGGYRTGTVRGGIYNNYGRVVAFYLYVQGAPEIVPVEIGDHQDVTSFQVRSVADLGFGLHSVAFIWSTLECANGKEYAAAVVDVVPGETVDAGTLTFQGNCGEYHCESVSWRADGSEIAVQVVTPRRFQAAGQALGAELFAAPLTANQPTWSSVDDRILYHCQTFDPATAGIYLTTANGGPGTRLVPDQGAVWVGLAWLPDGSGFCFSLDSGLYAYDLATGQLTPLLEVHNELITNPSPSADGTHIVFERQGTGSPLRRDLWILNRLNPVEVWPLTSDGQSTNPDWSRGS